MRPAQGKDCGGKAHEKPKLFPHAAPKAQGAKDESERLGKHQLC